MSNLNSDLVGISIMENGDQELKGPNKSYPINKNFNDLGEIKPLYSQSKSYRIKYMLGWDFIGHKTLK